MPIPAPKDNPPLGLTTTSGIPKRTIMKFVNAKDILKYLKEYIRNSMKDYLNQDFYQEKITRLPI